MQRARAVAARTAEVLAVSAIVAGLCIGLVKVFG